MKTKFGFFSLLTRLGKDERASSRRLLVRLLRDEAGSYLIFMTLLTPIIIGIAGLATEGGMIFYNHRSLQSAADAAAYSAATAYAISNSADITTQAEAIVASYGFVVGTCPNKVCVTASQVNFAGYSNAIQVTVTQKQIPLFSSLWLRQAANINVSAIAIFPPEQCVLALDPTASGAVTLALFAEVNLTGCGLFSDSNSDSSIELLLAQINGTVGTVGNVSDFFGGINPGPPTTGAPSIPDPYGPNGNEYVPLPVPAVVNSCSGPTTIPNSNPLIRTYTLPTGGGCFTGTGTNGKITVQSPGSLIVPATGTYTFTGTGGINVTTGSVTLNSPTTNVVGSIAVSGGSFMSNSANLNVNGNGSFAINVTGGTVTLGANTGTSTNTLIGGISISGSTVTLNSGIDFLDEGSLTMNGATLNGNGVTLVFTGKNATDPNVATMSVQDGSTVNVSAPLLTSGLSTIGMVMMGPNSTDNPNGLGKTYTFDAASTLQATGVVHLPQGTVTFAGIAGSGFSPTIKCTQIIADKISFILIAGLQADCGAFGKLLISATQPTLVQ